MQVLLWIVFCISIAGTIVNAREIIKADVKALYPIIAINLFCVTVVLFAALNWS